MGIEGRAAKRLRTQGWKQCIIFTGLLALMRLMNFRDQVGAVRPG
jgi:hypothetical protein